MIGRPALLGVALLCALLLPALGGSQEGARQLAELREKIEAREAHALELAKEAKGVLGELEGIDRQLNEVRRSLRLLREQKRVAEKELVAARERVGAAEQSRSTVQKQLERRLVALYKFYVTGGVPTFYGAASFQELLMRRSALARVLEQDERLVARYRATEARWMEAHEEAAALVSEIRAAQRAVTARDQRVRDRLVERRNLVALLRTRADRERRVAAELREAAERLERLLEERMGPGPSPGKGLVAGQVGWPAEGSIRLGFGRQVDPEFGTVTLRNGIEIEARPGDDVQAVAPGRVLFAGWFKGYGQIAILDHGAAHVSISGYLEDVIVEPGELVGRGEVIGRVGETGSWSGPGLYFEIRHHGEPVDPEDWFGSPTREGTQ